jgi:ribosome maturation factor RimP
MKMNLEEIKNTVISQLKEKQFLVDIKHTENNQVLVYIDDYNGLTIAECKRISKTIASVFDREVEDYSLEVSSPGLDKPFKVIDQYFKNLNKYIFVLLKDGIKYEGILKSVDDRGIRLEITKKINKKDFETLIQDFEFKDIKKANLKIDF